MMAWRNKSAEELRAYNAAYRSKNRAAINAAQARWRAANPELARSRVRAILDADPARGREYSRRYRAKIGPARSARRRAVKLQAIPSWADERKIAAVYRAAKRLSAETGTSYHVDHIVPLRSKIVCGLHCEANLEITPGVENMIKGNRYWPDMP